MIRHLYSRLEPGAAVALRSPWCTAWRSGARRKGVAHEVLADADGRLWYAVCSGWVHGALFTPSASVPLGDLDVDMYRRHEVLTVGHA